MEPGIPRWVAIVLVQAELTVLQTARKNALTCAAVTETGHFGTHSAYTEPETS
jgi:hypothetical protein